MGGGGSGACVLVLVVNIPLEAQPQGRKEGKKASCSPGKTLKVDEGKKLKSFFGSP